MSHASQAVAHDFYKILKVSRTATSNDIKVAYRKIALNLHPDKNDGCHIKSEQFKLASEAYETLSDNFKRTTYDRTLFGHHPTHHSNTRDHRSYRNWQPPPPNTGRKVYTSRPPPGFKRFDRPKWEKMHYKNGIMEEEIELAKKRARAASESVGSSRSFDSPLGKGFISRKRVEVGGCPVQRNKQTVVRRMNERRNNRSTRTGGDGSALGNNNEGEGSCVVM